MKRHPKPAKKHPEPTALRRFLTKMRGNEKGFTLIEALVAMSVLVIMAVGVLRVISQVMRSSVSASDRMTKTSIAQARMEEHKAQSYDKYVPNMEIPVLKPEIGRLNINPTPSGTPTYVVTPNSVNFIRTTVKYGSQVNLFFNATTNTVTAEPDYYVATPNVTPGVTPCDYYGDVSGLGHQAWGDPVPRDPCDGRQGIVAFTVFTPPNVSGNLMMSFVDYGSQRRNQTIWVDGSPLEPSFKWDDPSAAKRLSTDPAAPTTVNYPFNRFDTNDSMINVQVQQDRPWNNWGGLVEDGSNMQGFTIVGCAITPVAVPSATLTRTPTKTPTPIAGTCWPYTGSLVYAGSMTRLRFELTTGGNPYVYPLTGALSGYASYTFSVTCAGIYEVEGRVRSKANNWNNNVDTGANSLDVEIVGATPLFGAAMARWEEMNFNSWRTNVVTHRGTSAFDNWPQYDPARWFMSPGTYTIYFRKAEADYYMRLQRFRINLVSVATPTPVPGVPTSTPTPVVSVAPTTTPTPVLCTFRGTPVGIDVNSDPNFSGASPSYAFGTGCKSNSLALGVTGVSGSGRVVVQSASIVSYDPAIYEESPEEATPTPGWLLDRSGALKAYVRLENGMSVTLRVDIIRPTPTVTQVRAIVTSGSPGWYEISIGSLAGGSKIQQLFFDFGGASSSTVNRLAIDQVRVDYDVPENPNAVLTNITMAVMSSLWDYSTYAPKYIVQSEVEPGTRAGASKGYVVRVKVYNGKNFMMVTPTPGPAVAQAILVPWAQIDDKFQPVEISNSISP